MNNSYTLGKVLASALITIGVFMTAVGITINFIFTLLGVVEILFGTLWLRSMAKDIKKQEKISAAIKTQENSNCLQNINNNEIITVNAIEEDSQDNDIRFSNGFGGKMVKFCKDALVIAQQDSNTAHRIPYECIIEMKFSSWSGFQVTTNTGWSTAIYIEEKKEIKQAIESVAKKIDKQSNKLMTKIELNDNDKEFIEINKKQRKEKPFMSKTASTLLIILFIAISMFGAVFCLYDHILWGMCPLLGGVFVLSALISSRWPKVPFFTSFIIILFCIMFASVVIFGVPSKEKSTEKNDGFYGSDGEYHEYIPEFGDDVNNWMEENW